jgi:hypothetical protein
LLKANIELPNLLWLANHAYEQFEKNPVFAQQALDITHHILTREDVDPKNIGPETLVLEPLILHYAKLLQYFKQPTESIAWLEILEAHYKTTPELNWHCLSEARLNLAESLLAAGSKDLAEALFDTIASSSILRDRFAATAALQSARIKQTSTQTDPEQILTMLKNIALQKTLVNEPIHLEAAIDYVELLASLQSPDQRLEKSLDLLIKTKANFTLEDDLLSKDYHAARNQNSEQNQIYLNYMVYLDAKILLVNAQLEKDEARQKELNANAQELLLQITNTPSVYLQRRLETLKANI